jgi:transposase
LLNWVEHHAGWAAAFTDESWFVLWPRQSSTWSRRRRPRRIKKAKSWRKGQAPPSTCLYAALDVRTREVTPEWHETWNQSETWQHLKGTIRRYAAQGYRYLVLFWDNAPWHLAQRLHRLVARYNRHAKRHGRLRVLLFALPIKAPWLMPLEAVFGQTKRAVGPLERESLPALQHAVEQRLDRRNAWAHKSRPDDHPSTQLLSA